MDSLILIKTTENHFEAIKEKRLAEILNSYANSEDLLVFVEGPRWETLGYENVAKGWRDFISSEISMVQCAWLPSVRSKIIGEMGFVAGIVELEVQIKDQLTAIKFRGTFVLEKESDESWRIIHEHFSQPAEDPYGIGDWLKKD
ncbi:MAG: nuclear transport factor 2 family protein [Acidobacteriota bacterium]|nr:nuclear transport factor 2 family protein [Acidobacteriota bacterium]